ncbi:hypothetical protein PR048_024170 [Dryococelus australis]|uniref:Uncharacterized protein n=1 Tax=Dryococelus australis TaxID=614101 RepID=A0ABQ9GW47_9NEOP|nr:hypothetical protein PR048_024170 [Dryococelus australis]
MNKTSAEARVGIGTLPAVPSHYCRSSSTKMYIRTEFESLENVYRLYKEDCKTKGIPFIKSGVLKKAWRKDYNIGIHIPNKCAMCVGKEEGNLMSSG